MSDKSSRLLTGQKLLALWVHIPIPPIAMMSRVMLPTLSLTMSAPLLINHELVCLNRPLSRQLRLARDVAIYSSPVFRFERP